MGSTAFAVYGSREITVRYFNGAGYVVRREMYPHTTFTQDGPVTRQGLAMLASCRQGTGDAGGFAVRRYALPDTEPAYVPA